MWFSSGDFGSDFGLILIILALPFIGAMCKTKKHFIKYAMVTFFTPLIILVIPLILSNSMAAMFLILLIPAMIFYDLIIGFQYLVHKLGEKQNWELKKYWSVLVLLGLILPLIAFSFLFYQWFKRVFILGL